MNNKDFPNFDDFRSSFDNNMNFDSNVHNENSSSSSDFSNMFSGIDMNTILKIKKIMEKMNNKKGDPRSNLLLSLKPYLKPSRKEKVDQYIQLFKVSTILQDLDFMGGEGKK